MIGKSFNWNGESVTVDFSKISNNGSGVLVSASGTNIFCSLDVGFESGLSFKDISVNIVERYGITGKIPNNYKKKDLVSESSILVSKMIDRLIRPMIRDDLGNSVKFTFYILSFGSYSIEILSVLGASLLANIAKIANDYFSLVKITNNCINYKDNLSDTFRLYHGVASNSTIIYDFENLHSSIDNDSIIASYKMSLLLAKDCIEIQKSIVQSLNFKSNYFYHYKNSENTNKSEALDIASKMFEAIISSDHRNINKFNQFLLKKDYYFNYLVNQEMKSNFKNFFNNKSSVDLDDSLNESIANNTLLTTFFDSKVFTTFVRGDVGNIQYIDSMFGNIKNTFLVQFHEGSNMGDINGSSRHELNLANFIRKSFSVFLDKKDIIRVSCDVLVEGGNPVSCAVIGIAKLLNIDIKSFTVGLIDSQTEKFFIVNNKYERKIFCDMCCIISGDKNIISAVQIDCSKIFFGIESFIKLINFYFSNTLKRERVKNNKTDFKINIRKKNGFSGDDYLSGFDIKDENSENLNNKNTVQFVTDKQETNFASDDETKFISFNIPKDKIGLIIGKKGSVINEIRSIFNVKIDINDDGKISINSNNIQNNSNAMQHIIGLIDSKK